MRPATPTGVPLVGNGGYRNLWLNLGHGALGFTLACGSGRLLLLPPPGPGRSGRQQHQ